MIEPTVLLEMVLPEGERGVRLYCERADAFVYFWRYKSGATLLAEGGPFSSMHGAVCAGQAVLPWLQIAHTLEVRADEACKKLPAGNPALTYDLGYDVGQANALADVEELLTTQAKWRPTTKESS